MRVGRKLSNANGKWPAVPFNSDSYYRNKWRREALASLAEARQRKAEPDAQEARIMGAGYNERQIAQAVRSARSTWRLYLSQRTICRIKAEGRNRGC